MSLEARRARRLLQGCPHERQWETLWSEIVTRGTERQRRAFDELRERGVDVWSPIHARFNALDHDLDVAFPSSTFCTIDSVGSLKWVSIAHWGVTNLEERIAFAHLPKRMEGGPAWYLR